MTQPLSPAAQAVLDAFLAQWDVYAVDDARHAIAAALRAAADQVVPARLGLMHPIARAEAENIRADFLAIAAELEGQALPQPPTQPTIDP